MGDHIGRFECVKNVQFDIIKTRQKLFNDWYKTLMNICLSMFDYEGLPQKIPKKDLEFQLLSYGYSVIPDEKINGDYYALTGGLGGKMNAYYIPTEIVIANPFLNYDKTLKIGDDCTLILNDDMFNGLNTYLSKYASLLTSLDISFYWGIVDTRVQKLYEANNDDIAKSVKDALDSVELGNELKTIAGKPLFDLLKVHEYSTPSQTTSNLKALIETRQYILAQFYIGIGLNANYNMKRESLNENELNADSDTLLPLIDNMLECRKEAFEEFNKKHQTKVIVKLSKRWEDIRTSLDAMLKEQENQAQMKPAKQEPIENGGDENAT